MYLIFDQNKIVFIKFHIFSQKPYQQFFVYFFKLKKKSFFKYMFYSLNVLITKNV